MRLMSGYPSRVRQVGAYPVGQGKNTRTAHIYLASGLLRCHECGGPMKPLVHKHMPGHKGTYICRHKQQGASPCRAVGYRMDLAHEALLREVGRLRGSPWAPTAERRLSAGGEDGRERARALGAAIAEERRLMQRDIRLQSLRGDEPGPAELEAFAAVASEREARIARLEKDLASVQRAPDRMPDLQALHARLSQTELRTLFARLLWTDGARHQAAVRAILLETVSSAVLLEREPARYSTWLRMQVTWTADVQDLLDAHLLQIEAGPRSATQG
jgi:hypothetical protein